jgi:diguanylate cyclase (GGDEF)-like protein
MGPAAGLHKEIETMSPNRPEREAELHSATPDMNRPPGPVRETVVSGPAELEARIELHLAHCRRRRSVLALLCVSVATMESAGESVGPDLERRVRDEVSHRICNRVRGSDRVLRESDRDACVVLPDATEAVARRVAARFAKVLNGEYRIAGQLVTVEVHIGIAAHPQDGVRAPELLRRATDRARGLPMA